MNGGGVQLDEKTRRLNRFQLAYGRALIEAVAATQGTGRGELAEKPYSELVRLLQDLGAEASLTIKLNPWSTADAVAARLSPEPPPNPDEFFVPTGFRLLERVFGEFVSERYVGELLKHLHAYVELYTFGVTTLSAPERAGEMAWRLDDMSREHFTDHLRRHYLGSPWQREAWTERQLTRAGLERLKLEEMQRRVIEEDRDGPIPPTALEICADLLADGPLGWWEKHRVPLSSEFRAAFIDGRRVAYAIDDDGGLAEIGRDWWQGSKCTRLLLAREFRRPDGVLLERTQPAPIRGSLQERVSAGVGRLQGGDGEAGGAAENVRRVLDLLRDMVEDGRLPLESHTAKEVAAKFRAEFPDVDISGRGIEAAIAQLMLDFPQLKAPRGRPARK